MTESTGYQLSRAHRQSVDRASQRATLIYLGISVTLLAVMLADYLTPLGVATWVFYMVPITLSLFLRSKSMPLVVAAACTVLMSVAFITDTDGTNREIAQLNRVFGVISFWVIGSVGYYYIANNVIVRQQAWIQSGKSGLAETMGGDLKPAVFGENVLTFLAEFLDAEVGAFFVSDGEVFHRTATYGVPSSANLIEQATASEGLIGKAIKSGRVFQLTDIPDGYLAVGSSLGQSKPRDLIVVPMNTEKDVNAVAELGFMRPVTADMISFLEAISEPVGVAVASSRYRSHLQKLLLEKRQQAEELQQQGEELRVSNEELEVQSRVLQQSQAQLEQQQVELEQSNIQLEEHTQLLQSQRDELARATLDTQAKARELEAASRYKSDFLANMSHELRTPLNSSLILAKLLAENSSGNLTDEQVESAETIHSAGNDLLRLINDILDLSKIEAGKMTIRPETTWLADVVSELDKTMRPLAVQKNLSFHTSLDSDVPEQIVTDHQRLEQILKNLLSNAIKFTDHGEVGMRVSKHSSVAIKIEVTDTGIGIADEDQQAVFEAFRQVDSAATRKFSGTGLGLSITMELTRILGGEMHLSSQPDQGSTFTLILPTAFRPAAEDSQGAAADPPAQLPQTDPATGSYRDQATATAATTATSPARDSAQAVANSSAIKPPVRAKITDDRENLRGDRRLILVVEDDESFAAILAKVAHEMEFQCLIAASAQEALILAAQFLPQAIVLDIGLPDETGLVVLDRLKQDARTRHIPVHVISANDFAETALALGAVGYAFKPVTRELLLETLQSLQMQLNQRTRRVLVVEDDAVQLESLQKLLASRDVETVGAQSVAECLEHLKSTTFDCMVLDLSLPDSSGYSLLETLSNNDDYSFPPVIIYTGRELSAEQEQSLRRYSKSIIIKGAKSPERLLDEVTLFLHQVVEELPEAQQKMIQKARSREAALENRRILVVEDDVRNIFALTSILEPRGAIIQIARNGKEALVALDEADAGEEGRVDLVLMDVMMPEMDGLTATREIRKQARFSNLPIIMLTAKAMKDDQLECIDAGANDYMAKPLDIDKLLSLVRVWIRK
ncbi:response regulator [Allorhodopirellula solitaria]|uniref:histidine kinase n=1 Tax=Allorhodopirellula solitaria TaxID=2527987 RepID=A0A5C5XU99_9BACT|nr:response regulator [Allorhodopirellula solitaria]TWT66480.1 Signal transduction histidine-protein kinase BarA [Allorhodopirellula solitaria]